MKKNYSKKESERVLRLRKQLKESIVRANEAETKVIENDDFRNQFEEKWFWKLVFFSAHIFS